MALVGRKQTLLQVWGICLAELKAAVVAMPFYPPKLPYKRHQYCSEKEAKFTTGRFRGFFCFCFCCSCVVVWVFLQSKRKKCFN